MKKNVKKLIGFVITGAMMAGMIQTNVFASRNDFASDFNTAENQVISADTVNLTGDAPLNVDFPAGLAGRSADDHSARQTFNNSVASSGFQLMQYASEADTRSKWDRCVYECSLLYSGDADYVQMLLQGYTNKEGTGLYKITCNISKDTVNLSKYFMNSSGYKSYPNSIKAEKDQWIRLVLDFNTSRSADMYINGQKFTIDVDRDIMYLSSFTFTAGFDKVGDGTKTGSIAIDDVKVTRLGDYNYKAPYAPSGQQATEITCDISDAYGLDYDSSLGRIIYTPGTTVQNVLDSVTVSNGTAKVIKSKNNSTEVQGSSKVSSDNVLVIVSNDGGTYKYISFVNGDESRIISYNPMQSTSSFTIAVPDGVVVDKNVDYGMYAKEADDVSYTLTSSTPGTARSNYLTIPDSLFNNDSFTYEFSVALDGVFDEVALVNFASTANNSRFAYNKPVTFKNGCVYVNDNGKDKYIRNYRNDEWYRIGITYYPKELKQDIYVNGVKEVSKGWVVNDVNLRDPETYKISSLYWNNIAITYSNLGEGKVAIDDTLLYTGEHFDTDAYSVSIDPDTLSIGNKANDIYLDELGEMEIGDLIDDLNVNADDVVLYTDSTYEEEAEDLDYSNVLVLTSSNGYVKEYYTILPSDVKVDNVIKCYVNGEEGTVLPSDGAADICVKAKGFAPTFMNDVKGCLILAVYEGDKLVNIVFDDKQIKSDTSFKIDYTLENTEGCKAKAFFFDSLQGMKPYASAKIITVSE